MLVHPSSGACDLLWIYFMCCIALVRCVLVLRCGSARMVWYPYVYWTVHHLDIWIKIDQLDVTCFIISLYTAQHVSNVSTSIFRSLRFIVVLFRVLYCSGSMCVGVTVLFGWGGVVSVCKLKHCFSLHTDTTHHTDGWWNHFPSPASLCSANLKILRLGNYGRL